MPSVPERLATLEGIVLENRRRIEALYSDIHSGPGVEWKQSIRGRIHDMSGDLAAADKLAEALREDLRRRDKYERGRIKRWQWVYLAVCATLAAMAPYVILLVH